MVFRGISDFCTAMKTERKRAARSYRKGHPRARGKWHVFGRKPSANPKVCTFPAPSCMRMDRVMSVLETTARSLVQRLRDAGFTALYAGGCVRDMLLGIEPHDYDI